MSDSTEQLDRLKNALKELRVHQHLLSADAASQIVMALLERMRRLQTTLDNNPTPVDDEIRLVTVMFVDVKDSTSLSQQLDTSDWKLLIEEAHRRTTQLIAQYDGTIGQYLGDGVLAFFGAQRSRGDDALRCVMCALAVQASMQSYANDVFLEHGVEFAIRIGISTGKLVVGVLGVGNKQELLALGPATNLAARLQSEADANSVMVDGATYSRIRQYIKVKAFPLAKMKGFDEPVSSYEVLGRSDQAPLTLTQTHIEDFPLLLHGREQTLESVQRACKSAFDEASLLSITVTGDIGMGKSRLLQEVMWSSPPEVIIVMMIARYEERGSSFNLLKNWLTNFCQLSPEMPQTQTEERILESITSVWEHPNAQNAAHAMGYLSGFGFEGSTFIQEVANPLNSNSINILMQEINRFFLGITQQSPLLILIDNLQWADFQSIRWLNLLAKALSKRAVVILAGARLAYQLIHNNYLDTIHPERRVVFTLERLDEATTKRMVNNVIGDIPRVPSELSKLVVTRSEGNPLFVTEFLASLFDGGVFQRGTDGIWRFNLVRYDSTLKTLPTGLVEMVQARLDELTVEFRQVLQMCAIVGQTLWSSIIEELAGKDPETLLAGLVARGILIRDPQSAFEGETQYHFLHSLYREVAYEMLPRAKREGMHRQISRWLVTRVANKSEYFATLAYQFESGAQHEAALFTYSEAVQSYMARGLVKRAITLIELGLAVARNLPRETAIGVTPQLWVSQAQCFLALGRYDEASASSHSALRLLNELPAEHLQDVRVQAARCLGIAYTHIGNFNEAHEALTMAYQRINETDNVQMAEVLRSHGVLMLYKGRLTDAMAYQQRAMLYSRSTGQAHQLNASMTQLGAIALERGDISTAISYFEGVLDNHHQAKNAAEEAFDLRYLGLCYLAIRMYERAFTVLDTAQKLLAQNETIDNLTEMAWAVALIGIGKIDKGVAHIKAQDGKPQDDILSLQVAQTLSMFGLLIAGEPLNCLQRAKDFLDKNRDGNPIFRSKALLLMGRAKFMVGEPNAIDYLREGLELEQEFAGKELGQGFLWLGEALPRRESARAYERAAKIVQAIGNSLYQRADLQYAFFASPYVRETLARAGIKG